jgi:undecaprenyl-diphosphatase
VDGVIDDMLSPTAPGHPAGSGVVVDPAQVLPHHAPTVGPRATVLVCGVALAALVCLTVASRGGAVPALDVELHEWVMAHRSDAGIALARVVTVGGITTWTLPTLVVVGMLAAPARRAWRSRLGAGALLAGAASLGVVAGLALNSLVGRVRPPVADWAGAAGGPSFPSGHTTAATLFALSCAWALSGRVGRPGGRRALWIAAALWAGLVGWSRVWLGVHWPSDVVAGWLVGGAWMCLVVLTATWARRRWGTGRGGPDRAG